MLLFEVGGTIFIVALISLSMLLYSNNPSNSYPGGFIVTYKFSVGIGVFGGAILLDASLLNILNGSVILPL